MRSWHGKRCSVGIGLGRVLRSCLKALLVVLCGAHAVADDATASLNGMSLKDQLGQSHDIGSEVSGHLCLMFPVGQHIIAKAWDDALSPLLPKDRGLVRIVDASDIAEEDRTRLIERLTKAVDGTQIRFLLDWTGEARKRMDLTDGDVWVVACTDKGTKSGQTKGRPLAAALTRALALIGIVPNPPLVDAPQKGR